MHSHTIKTIHKKIFVFFFFLAAVIACSSPDSFVIKGEIGGSENEKISLMKFHEGSWTIEDTSKVVNDQFILKGSVSLPEMRVILLGHNKVLAQFFAENGTIRIKADEDSIENTEVSGSASNDDFSVFTDELKRFSIRVNNLKKDFTRAGMAGDAEKQDKAKIEFEAMIENQKVFTKNFIRKNRNSTTAPFVALWQLSEQMESEDIDTLVAFFDPSIQGSIYIEQLKKKASDKRTLRLGEMAPDFTMASNEGNSLTLSSFRGKVVLIDFWASWCKPCRSENPKVVSIYNKYKDKGFDIIGVSLDKDKESWLKAIEDDGLEWNHVSDLKYWNNEAARLYKVKSIPHTVLLDKNGKIIASNLRGESLENKLDEIFSE